MSLPTEVFDNTTDLRNYVQAHIVENNTRSITEEHINNILNSVLDILDLKGLKIGVSPVTDGISGSLLYVNATGKLGQADSLFYDETNNRLGIGTNAPTHALTLGYTDSVSGIAVYNTADQTTNFERGYIKWHSGLFRIVADYGGTGIARGIYISSNSEISLVAPKIEMAGAASSTYNYVARIRNGMASSALMQNFLYCTPSIEQSGSAGYCGIKVSVYESTTGSGSKKLIDLGFNNLPGGTGTHTSAFSVDKFGNIEVAQSAINGLTLYATSDILTNYEAMRVNWSGTVFKINGIKGGTGSARGLSCTGFSSVSFDTDLTIGKTSPSSLYGISLTAVGSEVAMFKVHGVNGDVKIGGSDLGYFPAFYVDGSEFARMKNYSLGVGVIDGTASVDIVGSNSGRASLRIRSGSEVSSPSIGDIWHTGTNLRFYNGSGTFSVALKSTSLTAGLIPFASADGSLTGSSNFVFDATNERLGIGVISPTAKLHVAGSTTSAASLCVSSGVAPASPGDGDVWNVSNYINYHAGGVTYLLSKQAAVLTSTRIAFADVNGNIKDDAALCYSSNTLYADNLQVVGNAIVPGFLRSGGSSTSDAHINIGASSTARAHLRLTPGVAPSAPSDGQLWYDGTDIYFRQSGTTKKFTLT